MKELFGTDGIRGVAGEFPLDRPTVSTIGESLALHFKERLGRYPRFLSGRDTRESGEWIESAFHSGAVRAGATCISAGVITTPGVAFLTNEFEFDAGIVISASHNPYQDNGIKIFSPSGRKIDDDTEKQIEHDIATGSKTTASFDHELDYSRVAEFRRSYEKHLSGSIEPFTSSFKIVIDCANGAASSLAPEIFAGLKTKVVVINDSPNGRNINEGCGSLHLEKLQAARA